MRGRSLAPDAQEHLTSVRGRVVRSLSLDERASSTSPLVVIVPGLGLPFYTLPTVRSLAARGLDATVLDLPGFGSSRPWATRPSVHAIGLTAARWVESVADGRPVVLLGHSTCLLYTSPSPRDS